MKVNVLPKLLLLILLSLAMACGATAYHRGRYLMDHGLYDDAVAQLTAAQKGNPRNVKYKTELVRAKLAASQKHIENAKLAMGHDKLEEAATELQKALTYDSGNQYAKDMLDKVIRMAAERDQKARQSQLSIDEMKQATASDTGVPELDPASNIPVVLKFNDASLKTILEALSKASGINFIYDDKTDTSRRVTVDFAKVSLSQVMDYLMMQTKNFYKVLDPHTLIVVPDTKQKRDEYQDQVIKTFYLSNADAKEVFQLIRSILQTRKMAMNQNLNSITIQDTPETVAIAQRIIDENDKSKGEVVVDVELLEVNSNKLRQLGISLSANTFTIGPGHNVKTTTSTDSSGGTTTSTTSIGSGPPIPLNELGKTLGHNLFMYPVPNLVVNMLLTDTDSQVLAKPQLRVMEGQKASVHIGDRIPIATANQYLGAQGTNTNYTPITSYTYQDVGVKIEIEPRVHHNREITIKLKSEVSSVSGYVKGAGLTSDQPIIGTREATTTIRLEDGETSLLAGLIRQEDSKAISGLPGISEIPLLRRLFSDTTDKKVSTDVVMLLTPHIVRMPNITEEDLKPMWVGTADRTTLRGSAFGPTPFQGKTDTVPVPQPAAGQPGSSKTEAGTKQDAASGEKDASADSADQKPEAPTAAAGRLLVSPTGMSVKVGETAVVNVVLVGAVDVKGLHLEVEFPNDVMTFQGADEGAFFKMGGAPTSFTALESGPGLIVIDGARTDGNASSGSGLVARLRFTASKPGVAKVNFGVAQSMLASGQATPLSPAFSVITVTAAPGGLAANSGETSGGGGAAK